MINYNTPLFVHPVEVWDEKKCRKLANRIHKDGCGTKHPRKGYLGGMNFEPIRYNGGCIRNGQWYQGERYPKPILAEGYELRLIPTWGWYIVKSK